MRSGHSPSAAGYPAYAALPHDGLSARTSNYATPEVSARSSSEFVSVYDASSSAGGTARTAEIGTVYEKQAPRRARDPAVDRRKHHAYAAAFDAFAPTEHVASMGESGLGSMESPPEASLDPRKVFSTARHGKHQEVEASLVNGFDPNYTDSFGNTLFHVACQNGNKRIAKLAIKYGGDMDIQNKKGNTGLHFLFAYGYPDIAEYFISKGADEQIPNEIGKMARAGIK